MKTRHITSIIIAIALSAVAATAGNDRKNVINGFSGGMMVHAGYLSSGGDPSGHDLAGMTFGIGGVGKIHLGKHFRTGFEGYFSNMGLSKTIGDGSFSKVFWAGALADWYWKCGKFFPYVGASVGGGMKTAFYLSEGDKHDWLPEADAVYNKTPFLAVDPFIGVEYAAGEGMHLTLKADWLIGISSGGINRPMGPRIYFGFIFSH